MGELRALVGAARDLGAAVAGGGALLTRPRVSMRLMRPVAFDASQTRWAASALIGMGWLSAISARACEVDRP
ncbi:hypothetical protein LNW71_18095 [Streptomyces sp. RKAG290]|nr:hypothetical protein [Streptomyces sp. RKAG290]MCM2413462.1 hypothetical protein [Streptomyces sp. RKAG290]